MTATINAHRLLAGSSKHGGYLGALKVSSKAENALRDAREKVRQVLREKLPLQQKMLRQYDFVAEAFRASGRDLPLKPKFRMQGSAVYHTLNDPAHKPPQEIDYDDGVFLPTSFLADGLKPALVARGYFKAVEDCLQALCNANGWRLDRSRKSCIRILGVIPGGHLDIPLYAIPDDQYDALVEARKRDGDILMMDTLEFAESVYEKIPDDHIMLAHREKGWLKSDPRKIEEWFKRCVQDYGDGLRHICRYLKGWRDFTWLGTGNDRGPSSLALMACVVRVYEEFHGEPPRNREDLALLWVVERLPELFAQRIPNPNPEIDETLCDDWGDNRAAYIEAARQLEEHVRSALQGTLHKDLVIQHLRNGFGDRIPAVTDLLDIETAEEKVLEYTAAAAPRPHVDRTISG